MSTTITLPGNGQVITKYVLKGDRDLASLLPGGKYSTEQNPFILRINTLGDTRFSTNKSIELYINAGSNITIDWGDGVIEEEITTTKTHTYPTTGYFTLKITGVLSGGARLLEYPQMVSRIEQWGDLIIQSHFELFENCTKLTSIATDAPTFIGNNASKMFYNCRAFNGIVDHWDVSNISYASQMFSDCRVFNSPLNSWNTSNLVDATKMLQSCWRLNTDLRNWDVSNVTNMKMMFYNCNTYDQPLDTWDTGKVTDMDGMFYSADLFNQDLSGWDVSKVISHESFNDQSSMQLSYLPTFP